MPDIPDRLTRESELTRDLNTQFTRQRQVVRSANGPDAPWSTFQSGIELAFITHLGATFEIARRLFLVERAATDEELALFLFLIGSGDLPLGTTSPPAKPISGEDWARGVAGPLASRVVAKSQEGVSRAATAAEAAGRSQDDPSSADAASKKAFQDGIKTSFSATRAESIAVTETTGAVSAGEGSAAEIVGKQKSVVLRPEWVTEKDARVCPICEPLHRKPEQVWVARFPNGPPAHPRCLLPGTRVLASDTVAAMRFRYDGPTVTIRSSKGRSLTVTSNHQILTPTGFVGAKHLAVGDYVLGSEVDSGVTTFVDPDDDHVPAEVQDIFSAGLEVAGVMSCSVPISSEHFHGDGDLGDGDVDIVTEERLFRDARQSGFLKTADQFPLCASGTSTSFDGISYFDTMLVCLSLSAHGIVSELDQLQSLTRVEIRHPVEHRLAAVPGLESSSIQTIQDHPAADVESLSRFIDRFSSLVAADEIVHVDDGWYSGHVYDLQTVSGLYFAGDLLTSNCRCWLVWRDSQGRGIGTVS